MEAGGIRNRTPNTNTNKHSLQNTTFHISGFLITAVITVYTKPAAKLGYFVPDTHS